MEIETCARRSKAVTGRAIAYRAAGSRVHHFTIALRTGSLPNWRKGGYLGSWLEVLREDNRAIFRAASQASKAADYILAFDEADERRAA